MKSVTSSPVADPRVRFIATRIFQSLFVVWAAFTIAFFLLYWLPGDAVLARLGGSGDGADVPPEQLDQLRAELGLDRPLVVQYLEQLGGVAQGNFGTSVRTGEPVVGVIGSALPHTLALAAASMVLAVIVGGAAAMTVTYTHSRVLRRLIATVTSLGVAVPAFWVGLILLWQLSFQHRWFPAGGNDGPLSLVLPAITLAFPASAVLAQVLIESMRTALAEPYIATARAKGVAPRTVHGWHALRNALFPVLTMLGLLVGNVIAGSVAVETVFSRAGLGRVTVDAVELQDLPVIQGLVVTGALIFVTVNLAVDLLYPLLDPRVRLNTKAGV